MEQLKDLTEAIDHLMELSASDLCHGASIKILQRQLAQLQSFVTEAVADFDVTP